MKWFSSNFNPCLEKQRDWEFKEIRKESKLRTSKLHDIPAARQRKESHLTTVYDNRIDRYRPRGWRSSSPPLYDPIFHGQSKLTIGLVDWKLCVWVKQDCAESDLRKARCQGFPCSLGKDHTSCKQSTQSNKDLPYLVWLLAHFDGPKPLVINVFNLMITSSILDGWEPLSS